MSSQVFTPQYCANCMIARGYYESYISVNKTVVETINTQLVLHPNYTIVSTGHSLGGALASIAALELRRLNNTLTVHLVNTQAKSKLTSN
jgi:predicted lipase